MLEMHGVSRRLASFNDILPGYVFSGVYFSNKFLSSNPDQVRAFLRGLIRSFDFIKTNEKKARSYIPKYTSVTEDVAMQSALRDLSSRGCEDFKVLDRQQDLLLKYGLIDKKVSLTGIVDYSYLPQ
jgi:ABC-type nitrate/sulfonate/bicarbonate transport system substrate-binding protein